MTQAETALTKYVFLDIVAFTKGRSVEAQSDLVAELNSIVRSALEKQKVEIESENTILLPTGDGICIALLEAKPYDIHLHLALDILAGVSEYNDRTDDTTRKMELKLGINENLDNIVLDINGRRNVAGNGINMARRILDLADGNQILIGQAVYEILSGRKSTCRA
jgi:class 3 adenylate cyclase